MSLACEPLRTFSGRFDIRPGVPRPPPRSCCSRQVAGLQMCQPIFINISKLLVLNCSRTECAATVIVDLFLLTPVFLLFQMFFNSFVTYQ